MRKSTILSAALLAVAALAGTAAETLVNIPVASLREEPRHASQMVSQAVAGTPVTVCDTVGTWLMVTTPDGYSGYLPESSVAGDAEAWRDADRGIVTDPEGCVLTDSCGRIMVRLPLNSIVLTMPDGTVAMPDGRRGTPSTPPADFAQWAAQGFDASKMIPVARAFMGAPYLWGGTTGTGPDCSGLVSLSAMAAGGIVRRDAWMQREDAVALSYPTKAGDLIFFDRDGRGRVDHVAILESPGLFIHSSGMVKVNALTPEFGDTISGSIVGYGRLSAESGGVIPVVSHPLYFRQNK